MRRHDPPRDLAPAALCDRCRAETRRFRNGEPHDDTFCLEVVRRAIEDRDERCWTELTALYQELVASWCRRAGAAEEEIEALASAAWIKFWQSYTVEKLAAGGSMAAALAYLKSCARSAVMDEGRRRARLQAHEEIVPGEIPPGDERAEPDIPRLDSDAFWELIARHLHDERERLTVYLTYQIGLRPAEIYRLHPDQFADVRDVYKVTRNVLDRLRRSRPLARWLEPDGE